MPTPISGHYLLSVKYSWHLLVPLENVMSFPSLNLILCLLPGTPLSFPLNQSAFTISQDSAQKLFPFRDNFWNHPIYIRSPHTIYFKKISFIVRPLELLLCVCCLSLLLVLCSSLGKDLPLLMSYIQGLCTLWYVSNTFFTFAVD